MTNLLHTTRRDAAHSYRPVIVACSFLAIFVNVGFVSTSFSVYVPYLAELPGMSHSLASTVLSLRALTSTVVTLLVARFYARFDCRLGMTITGLVGAAGFFVFAACQTFPALCVGVLFTGFAYGLGGVPAATLLIGRWFSDDKGKAIGIATMGSGVAGALVPLVVSRIAEAYSLSASFMLEAFVGVAVTVLLAIFLRNAPEDVGARESSAGVGADAATSTIANTDAAAVARTDAGTTPDGASAAEDAAASTDTNAVTVAVAGTGANATDAAAASPDTFPTISLRANRRFAAITCASFLVGLFCVGSCTYISALLTTSGFDTTFAAAMVSLCGIALAVGKLVGGLIFDRLGSRAASLLYLACVVAGAVMLCFATLGSQTLSVIGALFVGFGVTIGTVGTSFWSLELSDPATRSTYVRNLQTAYSAGSFFASLLPGVLMDITGTYITSYGFFIVLVALTAFLVVGVFRTTSLR